VLVVVAIHEGTMMKGAPRRFAVYAGGQAMALHLLELRDGRIAAITAFVDPSLFPRFGLGSVSVC